MCSSEEMGPLLLEVRYTSIPPALQSPNPECYSSSQSIHPTFFPHSSAMCVCMYTHESLLTCVSHKSLPRSRLPSWGDAWVPPVNFTAFIWPDEWLAALSAPLPAISSGSLEPHTACRFGRSLRARALLASFPYTLHAQRHSKQRCTITYG